MQRPGKEQKKKWLEGVERWMLGEGCRLRMWIDLSWFFWDIELSRASKGICEMKHEVPARNLLTENFSVTIRGSRLSLRESR